MTEELRRRCIDERKVLDEFGAHLCENIKSISRSKGIWTDVESRTKSIDGVLRKLIKKPHYTYETIPDLVGVRAIVRYRPDVESLVQLIQGRFTCGPVDDKSVRLADEGIGYLSVHIDARLKETDADCRKYPSSLFRAEVQVRTQAQHLWSEMAHDTFYKADQGAVNEALKRRINLMAGLLEVADNEFSRLEMEMREIPDMAAVKVLKGLEGEYYQFASERGDPDLSIDVIKLMSPLYRAEPGTMLARIVDFVAQHKNTIDHVFNEQRAVPEKRSVFFFQPEVLMLYELLQNDQASAREIWIRQFPDNELERVALAFGISFD